MKSNPLDGGPKEPEPYESALTDSVLGLLESNSVPEFLCHRIVTMIAEWEQAGDKPCSD